MPGRRGRPRRDDRPRARPPAEEILHAAGTLFAEKGVDATSTAEIARLAGLRQPSIFYYYPTKDDIVRALADRSLVEPLAMLDQVAGSRGNAAVKLFRLVTFHVRHDLSEPYNLTVVLSEAWRLPRDRYASWFEGADRYTHGMLEIVETGVRRRTFTRTDPLAATMGVLGMCNWAIRWYKRSGRLSPEDVADQFARYILRGLLRDPEELDAVADRATALDAASVLAVRAEQPPA